MQCPKCKHPLSDESVNCVYCGAPVSAEPVSGDPISAEKVSGESISAEPLGGESTNGEPVSGETSVSDTSEELSIEDMVMHTMEPSHNKREDAGEEADADSETDPRSLEKTAAMLAKMKGLLDNGRFDTDVYERMALDSIKDYLSTMDDSAQLIFVTYEIGDSKLAPFLTEDMIEKIKMLVMDTIAER